MDEKQTSLSSSEPDIHYREIQQGDNKELAEVIRIVLREHGVARPGTVYTDPTTDALFELFQPETACYFVATDGDKIIGGCGIYPTAGLPTGCAELVKLYLLKEYRNLGIGKRLIEQSIEFARKQYDCLYLETMDELAGAIELYKRLGFQFIDQRLGASGHFSCPIWMLKSLN